jgi:rhodanese-related sulfurtransferase/ABC-type phosphate/phosphonate transport system substrate-binding protein
MPAIQRLFAASFLCITGVTHAQLVATIAVEPSSRKESFTVSTAVVESALSKATGKEAKVTINEDLSDVMRATRTGEADVYIGPPQVAASAMSRGFELIGSTNPIEQYVLVTRRSHGTVPSLNGARLYLPQQDSIYSYLARGMLNAAGLSFQNMTIEFGRWPSAGLVAVDMGVADATVVRQSEWADWVKTRGETLHTVATSVPVPGGLSVVVRKALPAKERERLSQWFSTTSSASGLKPAVQRADASMYKAVAELGYFTPTHLPGATVVTAAQVRQLAAEGAVVVDTRSEKEYKAKHIPLAVFVPYHEKSLKDVAFDPAKDDFRELAKLNKDKPTIFSCNGAECWKSYKASRVALSKGFKTVYWFRGGLPEWEASGLQVAQD